MTTRSTELLRAVHRHPGITRAAAARLLGIGTGATTELVTKLSRAALLAQAPATPSGNRGRPTTVLLPHPEGPLVLALAITHEAWRLDVVELGGTTLTSVSERHHHAPWATLQSAVTTAVKEQQARYGPRLRAIGISVPGPVSRPLTSPSPDSPASVRLPSTPAAPAIDLLRTTPPAIASGISPLPAHTASRVLRMDAFQSDWHGIDLAELWPEADLLVAGNDATLAATAEHLRGASAGASVALHLRIESGLGGAVIENGRPVIGARNAAGEFGHMPFGDPEIKCACGANGCWGTAVDGTAMARLLGDPPPRDPVTYARRVIATATRALPSQRTRQDLAGLPPPAAPGSSPSPEPPSNPKSSHSPEPPSDPKSSPSPEPPSDPESSPSPEPPSTPEISPNPEPPYNPGVSPNPGLSSGPNPDGVSGPDRTRSSHAPGRAAQGTGSPYSSGESGPDIDPEAALQAVETVGIALGRGIAGLVNALDADLVTLGGIGPDLLATVPEAITSAYRNGLMIIHRHSPPPVLPATLPDDEGPIAGAAEEAWSALFPHLP